MVEFEELLLVATDVDEVDDDELDDPIELELEGDRLVRHIFKIDDEDEGGQMVDLWVETRFLSWGLEQ